MSSDYKVWSQYPPFTSTTYSSCYIANVKASSLGLSADDSHFKQLALTIVSTFNSAWKIDRDGNSVCPQDKKRMKWAEQVKITHSLTLIGSRKKYFSHLLNAHCSWVMSHCLQRSERYFRVQEITVNHWTLANYKEKSFSKQLLTSSDQYVVWRKETCKNVHCLSYLETS